MRAGFRQDKYQTYAIVTQLQSHVNILVVFETVVEMHNVWML